MNYKSVSSGDLNSIRQDLLKLQDYKCAICGKDLSNEQTSNQHVDHQHLYKSDELGFCGNGLIRGVLCRDCNALEGKIWNNLHRFGKSDKSNPVESRIEWLSNLLEYYKKPHYAKDPILHPKEKRAEKLGKAQYNKILKWYKTKDFAYKRNGDLKPFPKYTSKISAKMGNYMNQMREDGWEV